MKKVWFITEWEKAYLATAITPERLAKHPHLLDEIENSLVNKRKKSCGILERLHLKKFDPYGDRDVLIPELRKFVKEQREQDAYFLSLLKAGNK